ncbi:MAG: hypothetical protein DMG89_19115 [Acidobacteria bacterium]|nr:MAG: hypothetical protein DMG89_19115 [Acidobacteriota bacterium]
MTTQKCLPRADSIRALAIISLLSAALSVVIHAQVESGKIVGTVRDISGAVIADADVIVAETETNVERKTRTDNNGEYIVPELKPGIYTVTVERAGYKKAMQTSFKLDVNQVLRADLTLSVGSVLEEIEVTAVEPLIESETSSLGQVVEQTRVNDLPLNGRNFLELAYLTPGVNAGPEGIVQQGGIPENERGNGAIQVNGLTATNNNFLLNGFDNNEQQIGFEVIQPAIDAIQEFKVQTNNFGADIGRGGAVVNVVLKSGGNQFHGGLYEFVRNSVFDAKNYFDDPTAPIAPFKQNQFGGTFGGPIRKGKTFFFGDYQGTRIRQSQTDISFIPPQSERNGNFGDLCASGFDGSGVCLDRDLQGNVINQIYNPCDPGTGVAGVPCTAAASRLPFPNNQIPQNMLDPAALNVLGLFPAAPNVAGTVNQFLFNPVAKNNQDSFDIRVDHQLTGRDSLFGFFSFGNVDSIHPDPLPGLAGGGSFSGHIKNKSKAAGLSDVHTFSPTKINEFKLGYMRYEVNAIQNFANQTVSENLGIPGINDPNNLIASGGLTNINISGLAPLGNICCFPEFLKENNYQVLDAFTYIRGHHAIKVGGDLKLRRHGFFQALNPTGFMNFDQQFTADLNNSSQQTGNALATFELGYPISAGRDQQKQSFGMSWWEISAYAMDDLRASSKLTLNLGLRYDVFTPMVEDRDRLANFNFATGLFVAPGMPGVSRSGNVVTDLNNFSPRIGFAYTPWDDNKTVLRGGFGIFYSLQADQNDTELAYNPTGLFFSQSINNPASTPDTRLSTGVFPTPVYPTVQDPSGRTSAAPFNNRAPYIEEWNLNIERALVKDMALQVAYVGTHGVKLAFLSNLNQPVQPLDSNFSDSTGNFGRPYFSTVPDVAGIRTESHQYASIAHALQVKLEKRFSSGWSMLNAYTWQHTIGQTEENEFLEPQDTHNPAAERGDNSPDYRHQFSSAWSYELPFGPGKQFLNSEGPARWLFGGWQLNGIVSAHTGQAVTPLLSADFSNTGSGAYRPDVISDPNKAGPVPTNPDSSCAQTISQGGRAADRVHTLATWYNPCAFAVPALAPGQTFAHLFCNARRGSLRGPGSYNVDFSVFKDFKFGETRNLQFRAEAFNLFNHPQFGTPANTVDVAGFSGQITSSGRARELQLAFKLTF